MESLKFSLGSDYPDTKFYSFKQIFLILHVDKESLNAF